MGERMMEETRTITCECGEWEEFPADMARWHSQDFEFIEVRKDNEALYRCTCGLTVVSKVILEEQEEEDGPNPDDIYDEKRLSGELDHIFEEEE